MEVRLILVVLAIGIVCFFVGYSMGFKAAISWGIEIGSNFVEINVDKDMLARAIYQYQNNIDDCFAIKNEFIPND